MQYVALYTQSSTSDTTDMRLDATSDAQAVAELRKAVEAGYRNETHANVQLSDGRIYGASNKHGAAHGAYL